MLNSEAETPAQGSAGSSSHSRAGSMPTEKASSSSVRTTSRTSTKQSQIQPRRPSLDRPTAIHGQSTLVPDVQVCYGISYDDALVSSPSVSIIWIFGGTDESDSRDDVYTLDTETFVWGKPKPTGDLPFPSRAHTTTVVQNRYIFVVGGGQDFVYYDTVHIFDTLTHKWMKPDIQGEKPMARRAHTACLYNGRLFIFGGGNGSVALNDVWAMDVTVPFDKLRWEQIRPREGPLPPPRGYHTCNLVGNVMVIVGGSDGRDCYEDIWVMDLDTALWKQVITDDKHQCMFHTSTQVGSYLFILGGHNGQSFMSDLVLFNLVTLQYETRQSAGRVFPARGYHAAVLADSRLIVTGGFDGDTVYEDVSILDLAGLSYLPQVTRFGIIIDEQGVYVADEGAEYGGEIVHIE
ncbi:hypothetical protein OPQ81_001018 [Rhizoctonia solani]|nr:hypothetical protein OPQ81_001018 [Rhizoctonia solani]